ncbi:MAG: hypothetical protein ACRCZ0_12410 [Cetobacterium sp.]
MNIYLHYLNEKDITLFSFPIIPKDLEIKTYNYTGSTYNSLKHGEMFFYKDENVLKTVSFSSFFPSKGYHFSKNNNLLSWDCVDKLTEIRKTKKPIVLTITDIKRMKKSFRLECLIKDFNIEKHETTTGRTFFKIEFIEFKKLSAINL